MNLVKLKKSFIFSTSIRWASICITTIFVFFSAKNRSDIEVSTQWEVMAVLFCAVLVLWTTLEYVEIDVTKKTIYNYVSFVGLKFGKRESFDGIEKIFINRRKYGRGSNIFPRSIVNRVHYEFVFQSYIKFSDGEKMEFAADHDCEKLIERLKAMNSVFKTDLYNNTSGEAVLIH